MRLHLTQGFVGCVGNFLLFSFFWPFFWFSYEYFFASISAEIICFWFVFVSYRVFFIKFKAAARTCYIHNLSQLGQYFYLTKEIGLINHKTVLYGKKNNLVHEKTFWCMFWVWETGIIYDWIQLFRNVNENQKLDCL